MNVLLGSQTVVSFSGGVGSIQVTVGPRNTGGKAIEGVILTIPMPQEVVGANTTASAGYVDYDEGTKVGVGGGYWLGMLSPQPPETPLVRSLVLVLLPPPPPPSP